MRQAADETTFLQRSDEAMDAGFGPQIKRDFHFIERGRNTVARHAHLNELQKFDLLFGQHVPVLFLARSRNVLA